MNATSLGLHGEDLPAELEPEPAGWWLDLVYGDGADRAVPLGRGARRAGGRRARDAGPPGRPQLRALDRTPRSARRDAPRGPRRLVRAFGSKPGPGLLPICRGNGDLPPLPPRPPRCRPARRDLLRRAERPRHRGRRRRAGGAAVQPSRAGRRPGRAATPAASPEELLQRPSRSASSTAQPSPPRSSSQRRRAQRGSFDLSGAFERGAANDVPEFDARCQGDRGRRARRGRLRVARRQGLLHAGGHRLARARRGLELRSSEAAATGAVAQPQSIPLPVDPAELGARRQVRGHRDASTASRRRTSPPPLDPSGVVTRHAGRTARARAGRADGAGAIAQRREERRSSTSGSATDDRHACAGSTSRWRSPATRAQRRRSTSGSAASTSRRRSRRPPTFAAGIPGGALRPSFAEEHRGRDLPAPAAPSPSRSPALTSPEPAARRHGRSRTARRS